MTDPSWTRMLGSNIHPRTEFSDFLLAWDRVSNLEETWTWEEALERYAALADIAVEKLLEPYVDDGPVAYAVRWRTVRNMVPLQVRMLLEQAMWELGDEWRKLISGFGPLTYEGAPPEGREYRNVSIQEKEEQEERTRRGRRGWRPRR